MCPLPPYFLSSWWIPKMQVAAMSHDRNFAPTRQQTSGIKTRIILSSICCIQKRAAAVSSTVLTISLGLQISEQAQLVAESSLNIHRSSETSTSSVILLPVRHDNLNTSWWDLVREAAQEVEQAPSSIQSHQLHTILPIRENKRRPTLWINRHPHIGGWVKKGNSETATATTIAATIWRIVLEIILLRA